MGRYDFRPSRVLQTANQLLETNRISHQPPWYQAVAEVPPGETLVRPVHRFEARGRNRKTKAPSRMFRPMNITYPEDKLRREFFGDHPWELARPKTLLEDSGNDAKHWSWDKLEQTGKPLDGER
jgi:small subunit ribosomal protein S23